MAVAAIAANTLATDPAALAPPDMVARDTIIAWYRGEFAAANAIIDMLCSHIVQITGGPPEYESVFAAIHRRRMNWIPVLHMQRYYSIADVANELRHVASIRKPLTPDAVADDRADGAVAPFFKTDVSGGPDRPALEDMRSRPSGGISEGTQEEYSTADSSDGKMAGEGKSADGGSGDDEGPHDEHTMPEKVQICTDHEECAARLEKIKICKGFVAKEPVKGHMASSSYTRSGTISILRTQ